MGWWQLTTYITIENECEHSDSLIDATTGTSTLTRMSVIYTVSVNEYNNAAEVHIHAMQINTNQYELDWMFYFHTFVVVFLYKKISTISSNLFASAGRLYWIVSGGRIRWSDFLGNSVTNLTTGDSAAYGETNGLAKCQDDLYFTS